ncbi:MAG: hypothetical protein LBT01_08390 [Spirochaetaceae bacterium]|jgi:hypothetical protein|nr:hypothetical protein [Spirochaetaceae bacterium]
MNMNVKKIVFPGLALLVSAVFVFSASLGSCEAIASTTGENLAETVWISLTPSVPFVDGNGQRAATLTLDFTKAVDKLANSPSEADLANIFSFEYPPDPTVKLKATTISKDAEALYTLTVINVPDVEKGIVVVTINIAGIAPPTRPWSLDGKAILDAQSAKAANGGRSVFFAVAKDTSGCTYAVGCQFGKEEFSYGTVRVQGVFSGSNAVIVKYDKSGTALWARSVSVGGVEKSFVDGSDGGRLASQAELDTSVTALFTGVAVDNSGRVYVSGIQRSTVEYIYGANATAAGSSGSENAVIVQYDSNGSAKWAKSVTGGGGNKSRFRCVAADASGVYAGGEQSGSEAFSYGAGVSVAGSSDNEDEDDGFGNAVIVKYDRSGNALWAKSVAGTGEGSIFYGVAADGSGKVYAVGSQRANAAYDYGNGINARGGAEDNLNAVIVQYDGNTGAALWANSAIGSDSTSVFVGVAADKLGMIYAVGGQSYTGFYDYGGASVAGTGHANAVIVKYNSVGTALWAKSVSGGGRIKIDDGDDDSTQSVKTILHAAMSVFTGVAVDELGRVCASGGQNGNGVYDYGGASAQGNYTGVNRVPGDNEVNGAIIGDILAYNAVIVKYNSSTGEAQCAQAPTSSGASAPDRDAAVAPDSESTSDGSNASFFYGIAADGLGGFFTAGCQVGNGTFVYGNGVSAQANGEEENAVIVEFQ